MRTLTYCLKFVTFQTTWLIKVPLFSFNTILILHYSMNAYSSITQEYLQRLMHRILLKQIILYWCLLQAQTSVQTFYQHKAFFT